MGGAARAYGDVDVAAEAAPFHAEDGGVGGAEEGLEFAEGERGVEGGGEAGGRDDFDEGVGDAVEVD